MDEVKKKVLMELVGMMDEKMNDKLKSKMKPEVVIAAGENVSRPDKGWGAIIHKPGNTEPEHMAQMDSEDEDEERLREIYSKLS